MYSLFNKLLTCTTKPLSGLSLNAFVAMRLRASGDVPEVSWAEVSGLGCLPSPLKNITTYVSVFITPSLHLLYKVSRIMPTCTAPIRDTDILILRACEHVILLGKKHFEDVTKLKILRWKE